MNATLPRLHSDPRSPAMASPLPDMPVVRRAHLAANPRPQGPKVGKGAFNPGDGCTSVVGGARARRADAANAMRQWMFDPAAEQRAACARDTKAAEETQVSETA